MTTQQKSLSNAILQHVASIPQWRDGNNASLTENGYTMKKGAKSIGIWHRGFMHVVQTVTFTPDSQLVFIAMKGEGDRMDYVAYTADPIVAERSLFSFTVKNGESSIVSPIQLHPLTEEMVHIIYGL